MPKVSVIIPNYNHAAFLPQRIESVLQQSYRDFELIILDDHSEDHSRELILEYARRYEQIRYHFNDKNSGSPFAQWNRGCEMAKGDYLWFAESDDYCEPELLESLVPLLEENSRLGIAHCQSYLVNEEGEIKNSYLKNYEFIYPHDSWENDFIKNGREVCRRWLLFHNPIPNASAALIRREAFEKAGRADTSMRLNGDWFLYAKILAEYDLAFCARHLNYFRVHDKTQRARGRSRPGVYREIIHINEFIRHNVKGSETNANKAMSKVADWWIGNLYYHKWDKNSREQNRELYRLFHPYKDKLPWRITLTFAIEIAREGMRKTGLLKPAKQLRKKLFPGKYFEY